MNRTKANLWRPTLVSRRDVPRPASAPSISGTVPINVLGLGHAHDLGTIQSLPGFVSRPRCLGEVAAEVLVAVLDAEGKLRNRWPCFLAARPQDQRHGGFVCLRLFRLEDDRAALPNRFAYDNVVHGFQGRLWAKPCLHVGECAEFRKEEGCVVQTCRRPAAGSLALAADGHSCRVGKATTKRRCDVFLELWLALQT